jgi:uroporphyrinogen decarboxylase
MEIKRKKDKMTRGERWIALLNKKAMDRIPVFGFFAGFATLNAGLSIADYYNNPQKSYDAQVQTAEKFGFQETPYGCYAAVGGWEFGGEIKWPTGEFAQAPMVARLPVETEEDVWKLKAPDVKTAGINPIIISIANLANRTSPPYIIGFVEGPFTTASNISGMEKLGRWMLKKPDVAHRLIRLATDFLGELAKYWVDTFGAERMIIFEAEPVTANNMISSKQFEQFAFPYIKEQHDRISALGVKHILAHLCGEQNANLPFWAEIPMGKPGIVSFGAEVNLESASAYFPNDVIMGNIDPVIISSGTPQQVYEATRVCIEKGRKHPSGFLLAPGCELPPKSPEENVWAIMRAVNDFGWYE